MYKRQVLDLSKYFDTLNHEILINLLRKNVKDERVVPVSYTHLDVYKRQGLSHIVQDYKYPTVDAFLQVYKQGKSEYESYAVSYTHLDVYKRQVLKCTKFYMKKHHRMS